MITDDNFRQFSIKSIYCGYSFKSPRLGDSNDSNEYPQHMFLWRNKQYKLKVRLGVKCLASHLF